MKCPKCGEKMLKANKSWECSKCGCILISNSNEDATSKTNNSRENKFGKLIGNVGNIKEQVSVQVKKEEAYIKSRLDDDSTALVDDNEFIISKTILDGVDYITNKKQEFEKERTSKNENKNTTSVEVDDINQEPEKPKKETQKTDKPNYNNLELSDLQETLINTLPLIDNPSEYEENIINKYVEYNSEQRKELLKDCWTVTRLAEKHNIKRHEVEKAILSDEFLNKDLIGVFKVNPNNIRSLKILYRKPLVEEQQKQEIEIEEQINETIEQTVETFKEENINASNNVSQDNKKDNNKKKEKKGIGRKIMDFNLGKSIMDKGKAIVEEEKREVIEKISPLLPEYAKMLNTTPDKLYVTYTADTYMFRGTKHTSMDKNGVVMSIEDTKISYIVFGKIVGNRRTFFDTVDIYSISFKNITSISDKVLNIELKMSGDNSINIMSEDYFGKRFLSELLEKYNNFNNDSDVTDNDASNNDTSNADELLKYAELYKQGLLSEEEFEAKKKELL